jgi:hypothetical protein
MPHDYLAYWKPSTVNQNMDVGGRLNHCASNQFGRVMVGDIVWLISVDSGVLYLINKITVGQVTDFEGAALSLGTRHLWDSTHQILAAEGTAQPMQKPSIAHLAGSLRFASKGGKDRLKIDAGVINPQQLQTMRLLTPDSAAMLRVEVDRLDEPQPPPFTVTEELRESLPLVEGAVALISVNAYERNSEARTRCIERHGTNCCICGFNFGEAYYAGAKVAQQIGIGRLAKRMMRNHEGCRHAYPVAGRPSVVR